MSRFTASLAATVGALSLTVALAPATGATTSTPATRAASWLASQASAGYVSSGAGVDLADTIQVALALADPASGESAVGAKVEHYLYTHAPSIVAGIGTSDPGDLAFLILSAHAYGVNPKSFDKLNLVTKLEGELQGPKASAPGLYGTADPTYDGTIRQGLAMAALKAAGVAIPASAVNWLKAQRCSSGAFSSDVALNPCSGTPANYEGADTNSTGFALVGLSAAGVAVPTATVNFLKSDQNADGGWGFYPTNTSDPDSDAYVTEGFECSSVKVPFPSAKRGVANLFSFEITSGAGAGALSYPGVAGANLLATEQAVQVATGQPLWAVLDAGAAKVIEA